MLVVSGLSIVGALKEESIAGAIKQVKSNLNIGAAEEMNIGRRWAVP